jgi:4-aminobutyrate aminotransferase / (S)-3-amino-2-methylpropionate transaminase / 5-aminovalerate transaminase
MRALEFVHNPQSRETTTAETKKIVQYCYERGVLILSAGTYGNVIPLLMPLVISDEQFVEALDILQAAIASTFEVAKVA